MRSLKGYRKIHHTHTHHVSTCGSFRVSRYDIPLNGQWTTSYNCGNINLSIHINQNTAESTLIICQQFFSVLDKPDNKITGYFSNKFLSE